MGSNEIKIITFMRLQVMVEKNIRPLFHDIKTYTRTKYTLRAHKNK